MSLAQFFDALTRRRKVLAATVAIQEPFEGFSAAPYLDRIASPPVWTIGLGSTRQPGGAPVTAHTPPIDLATAREWSAGELLDALRMVEASVTVPLTVGEEAALLDLAYNVGATAVRGSTLLRLLNEGDVNGAAAEFEKWDHAGGKVVAGLLRRRLAERAEFLTPDAA